MYKKEIDIKILTSSSSFFFFTTPVVVYGFQVLHDAANGMVVLQHGVTLKPQQP